MKNTGIFKKIFIILTLVLIGITWIACDDKPEESAIVIPDPTPEPDPGIVYTQVSAGSYDELLGYLSSESTPYEVSLSMADKDIYLQKNVTVSTSIKLVGNPSNVFTIHSVNKKDGDEFYCLNVQGNLEFQYCEFIGYEATSASAGGVSAGSPPLMIKAGSTLTIGKNAALTFDPGYYSTYTATFSGGSIVVQDGGYFRNATDTLDTIVGAGISSLNVFKGGTAELAQGLINIGSINPTFDIDSGSCGIEINKGNITYVVDGKTRLWEDWTLEDGQSLHIKSGELEVTSDVRVEVAENFEVITMDGIIRLGDKSILYVDIDDPFPKLRGNGAIIIESTKNLPDVTIKDPLLSTHNPLGLKPETNARVEIGAAGFKVNRINTELPASAVIDATHYVANKLTTLVDTGVTLNIKADVNVIDGGILDVRGAVYVTTTTGIISIGKGPGGTNGAVRISGTVNVDNEGTFYDATYDSGSDFLFDGYDGGGTLIIRNTTDDTAKSGKAQTGKSSPVTIVGDSGLLALEPDATFEIGKRSGSQPTPTYRLTGKATLTLTSNIKLIGEFTANVGTTKIPTILTVSGTNTLTMEYPDRLEGPSGGSSNMPKINFTSTASIIQKKQTAGTYYEIPGASSAPEFIWSTRTNEYWLPTT